MQRPIDGVDAGPARWVGAEQGGHAPGTGGGLLGLERERRGKAAGTRMGTADRIAVTLMVVVPTLLVLWLVWVPGVLSVVLSFARWEGIGGIDTITWIGVDNYKNIFTIYPPFEQELAKTLAEPRSEKGKLPPWYPRFPGWEEIATHPSVANPNDLLLVCPSDHHIPDAAAFQNSVLTAAHAAAEGAIVTFGVRPNGTRLPVTA